MKVEIRRNRDLKVQFSVAKPTEDLQKWLKEEVFAMPPEMKAKEQECYEKRQELERQMWEYLTNNPTKDLDGSIITAETHEIGYDMEPQEIDGFHYMIATKVYVRPKKSEFE